jgi:hypothetical protein
VFELGDMEVLLISWSLLSKTFPIQPTGVETEKPTGSIDGPTLLTIKGNVSLPPGLAVVPKTEEVNHKALDKATSLMATLPVEFKDTDLVTVTQPSFENCKEYELKLGNSTLNDPLEET